MIITFYSVVSSIFASSILAVLIYFFRKKEAIANIFGIYLMLALYAITFLRMTVPLQIKYYTYEINDFYIFPRIMEFLTPDRAKFFVPQFTWLNLLVAVWIAGIIIYIFRFLRKYFKAIKVLTASPTVVDSKQSNMLNKIAKDCKIKRKVSLIVTDKIKSPMTYGFFKPVVLFPVNDYSDTEFYYIACHECCHIKNKDIIVKLLVEFYCAFFWWNPLVHLLKKDLVACLEIRCDKRALKGFSDIQRVEYAETLVNEMRNKAAELNNNRYLNSALLGMEFSKPEKESRIKQRISLIINPNCHSFKTTAPICGFIVTIAVVIITSYTFMIYPAWDISTDDCLADVVEDGGNPDDWTVLDETNSFVYLTNDGKYYLVFEPYDSSKKIKITEENSVEIPKEDIKEGYYNYLKTIKEE